jgi:hypothetical protein
MKRKEIIKQAEKSLATFDKLENVTDVEVGYTIALRHFITMLKSNKTK